jgi:hypothetical protein
MRCCRSGLGRWAQLGAVLSVLTSSCWARAQDVEGAKHWQLGEPAPGGYHVVRKHTVGIVGGSVLAGGYALSLVSALALGAGCSIPADGRSDSSCKEPESGAAPLLVVPIAGPFLAFTNENVRHDGGAVFWFSFFGTAQVAGAALLAYDLAVPHYGLKRGERTELGSIPPRWFVVPAYAGRGPALALVAQF